MIGFLWVLFVSNPKAQDTASTIKEISNNLRSYETIWTPEKTYVVTDKSKYQLGETIWIKTYILDGIDHKKSKNSNVVHLEILDRDNRLLIRKKAFVENLGCAFSFDIPKDIPIGIYRIRAFTKYMLNTKTPFLFEKKIAIGVPIGMEQKSKSAKETFENVKLSFHPEGGTLLYGRRSVLVIKSTDERGEHIPLKGEIRNGYDEVVSRFETGDFGLAKCVFRPLKGNLYHVSIEDGAEHRILNLPKIFEKGYLLTIENMGSNLLIKAETNSDEGLKGTTLLGHLRGEKFLEFEGTGLHGSEYNIKIPAGQLNDGIAHFTLFSKEGKPLCERLVYLSNYSNIRKLSLETIHDVKPENIRLRFDLKDAKGIPQKAQLSISVVKGDTSRPERTFKHWLPFYSDLGNSPLMPKILKEPNRVKQYRFIDALMITREWQRFSWRDMYQERSMDSYIPAEKGIFIKGRTTDLSDAQKAVPAMMSLDILGANLYQESKKTGIGGRFSFGPFDIKDSLPVVVKASKIGAKSKSERAKVAIVLDDDAQFSLLEKKEARSLEDHLVIDDKTIPKTKERQRRNTDISGSYDLELDKDITRLEEVVVTEKKKTRKERIDEQIRSMTLYNRPSFRVFADSLPQTGIRNVLDMFRTLPGVQVKGTIGGETVRIRYGVNSILLPTEPIYLIDGVQVPLDAIKVMSSLDVMFIDVLKGAQASIFGVRGANGAIAVYTRRGTGQDYAGGYGNENGLEQGTPNILTFTLKGFAVPKVFPEDNCINPETTWLYGTTVLWEPDLDIVGSNHNELKFCRDHNSTIPYTVYVEGITEDGIAISEVFALEYK